MQRCKSLIPAALALVLLAGCGSSGVGDIFGGGNGSQASSYEIRGTVDSVDMNGRSIYLTNVTGLNRSNLSSGSGSTARVYFDDRTAVEWQGKTYRPEDLERGDQVAIRVDDSNNRLMADSMTVTYNAGGMTSGSSYPSNNGTYNSTLRGTVRYVDTSRRTIEVDRGTGSVMLVEFDTNTPVYFNNSTYRVSDLERGDEIEVTTRDLGSGRYLAQNITVVRSISNSNGTYNNGSMSSDYQTIRGTVRSIDTSRRTIELSSPTWVSGFNQGTGSTMIVSYDANTSVDVGGQLHPVSGLERGDVVEVRVRNMGGSSYFADRVYLVRDVRQ